MTEEDGTFEWEHYLLFWCATKNYWFIRDDDTWADLPMHYDHPLTSLEIKAEVGKYNNRDLDNLNKEKVTRLLKVLKQ